MNYGSGVNKTKSRREEKVMATLIKHILGFFFSFASLSSLILNNTKLGSGSFEGEKPQSTTQKAERAHLGVTRAKHGGAGPLQLVEGTMLSAVRLLLNSAQDRHPSDGVPGRRDSFHTKEVGRKLVRGHGREG